MSKYLNPSEKVAYRIASVNGVLSNESTRILDAVREETMAYTYLPRIILSLQIED